MRNLTGMVDTGHQAIPIIMEQPAPTARPGLYMMLSIMFMCTVWNTALGIAVLIEWNALSR